MRVLWGKENTIIKIMRGAESNGMERICKVVRGVASWWVPERKKKYALGSKLSHLHNVLAVIGLNKPYTVPPTTGRGIPLIATGPAKAKKLSTRRDQWVEQIVAGCSGCWTKAY